MKLSVSLPDADVAFLDDYARRRQIASRSAAIKRAVDLLRAAELAPSYAAAWEEWAAEDAEAWDEVVADGLTGR